MDKEKLLNLVEEKLRFIYKKDYKDAFMEDIKNLIARWEESKWESALPLSEENVYLITYGDSIYEKGEKTLKTLHKFLKNHVGDVITDVHLLPMFEYTSDDGFSVVDYRKLNEELGDWVDIEEFSRDYRLMFDFVANHMSKSSEWFKGYLNDEEKYREYFIPRDSSFDARKVVRPRTSPLFHEYEGRSGVKTAWTTFSEDQVDVNFRHFPVLVEMTDIILMYANRGATSIRLDAIGFLWKESGTSCMHLPETHEVIKLWRLILDYFKANTQIITETNVPHRENISYFGDGRDEAHQVYQFSLPPLVLYTLTTHSSRKLAEWAKTIDRVSEGSTYFNFLASHDGIGMRPTEGILTEEEKQLLVNKVVENGGRVSYKNNPDGSQSVYELNINYHDALMNKDEDKDLGMQVQKMLAAHSILLSFVGVPAIYYHSLLGSRNDYEGLDSSGINRRINREKLEYERISVALKGDTRRNEIFSGLRRMINLRKQHTAFSPYASQRVLELGDKVFALERENSETGEKITLIVNVDSKEVLLDCDIKGENIITGWKIDGEITLAPYEFVWIKHS